MSDNSPPIAPDWRTRATESIVGCFKGKVLILSPNSFIIPLAYRIGLICGIGFRWLENHGSDLKSKKYNKTLAALGDANLIKIV